MPQSIIHTKSAGQLEEPTDFLSRVAYDTPALALRGGSGVSMHSNHDRQRPAHRQVSGFLIGGIVLLGCGSTVREEDPRPSSGGTGHAEGTGATGGGTSSGGTGASGGLGSDAGNTTAAAGNSGGSGGASGGATGEGGGTSGGATGEGTTPAECEACNAGDPCAGGLTPQVRCDNGTWDHDGDPATCCSPWATCAAGTYVSRAGSAATDRECTSCPSGSFSQSSNMDKCSPWTGCAPASSSWPQGGVATPGTATADAVCADPYFKFGSEGLYVAFAVAVDSGGNVYVAGNTYGAFGSDGGESDVFVRKLDAHGSVVWTQRFGTSSDDHAKGVAVDGSGNVYVAGTTGGGLEGANGGFGDAFVRKLDSSGATLWTRQLATWRSESANALAVDGQGNAYVAGTSYGGAQETGEAFVTKIDTNGAPAWTQLFGGPDEDEAMAIAVDGSGNAYVGGYTSGGVVADSDRGQRDAFVRKLDSSGTTSWTRQFGSTENDFVFAARVDGSGNLYVAGSTAGEVGGPGEGSPEAFVRKFDAGGATSWTHHAGNASYGYGFALAIDGKDDVYLVGSTSSGEEDVYVRKLDASGAAQWTKEIGTPRSDTALAAAADADGNLFVAGYTGVFFTTSDAFVLHVPTE